MYKYDNPSALKKKQKVSPWRKALAFLVPVAISLAGAGFFAYNYIQHQEAPNKVVKYGNNSSKVIVDQKASNAGNKTGDKSIDKNKTINKKAFDILDNDFTDDNNSVDLSPSTDIKDDSFEQQKPPFMKSCPEESEMNVRSCLEFLTTPNQSILNGKVKNFQNLEKEIKLYLDRISDLNPQQQGNIATVLSQYGQLKDSYTFTVLKFNYQVASLLELNYQEATVKSSGGENNNLAEESKDKVIVTESNTVKIENNQTELVNKDKNKISGDNSKEPELLGSDDPVLNISDVIVSQSRIEFSKSLRGLEKEIGDFYFTPLIDIEKVNFIRQNLIALDSNTLSLINLYLNFDFGTSYLATEAEADSYNLTKGRLVNYLILSKTMVALRKVYNELSDQHKAYIKDYNLITPEELEILENPQILIDRTFAAMAGINSLFHAKVEEENQ